MSQYILLDGFQSMDTAPVKENVNVCYKNGHYGTDCHPFHPTAIGWAPIKAPEKVKRYGVKELASGYTVADNVGCCTLAVPTESAAQRIADIYNEVMP